MSLSSPVPRSFFLQSHVFLCRGRRHWAILDVNRDKYLCVDRGQFEALGPLLSGWQESLDSSQRAATPASEQAAALADDLLRLNILSDSATHAKDALRTTYPPATQAFDPGLPQRSRRSSCAHAGTFFWSAARASRQLQRQRFQLIVESVRSRKDRDTKRAAGLDVERACSLVSVFERLRLFYPRSYLCLFDSLALIHFLARFHVYPDWVFGVSTDPFEAHCWVQAGNLVLNDTVARVSAFTPIMYI